MKMQKETNMVWLRGEKQRALTAMKRGCMKAGRKSRTVRIKQKEAMHMLGRNSKHQNVENNELQTDNLCIACKSSNSLTMRGRSHGTSALFLTRRAHSPLFPQR